MEIKELAHIFENFKSDIKQIIKDNHNVIKNDVKELKESIKHVSVETQENIKKIIEIETNQKNNKEDFEKHEEHEKEYCTNLNNKYTELSTTVDKQKGMHWRVLLAGIAIIGIGFTIFKISIEQNKEIKYFQPAPIEITKPH